MTEAREKSRLTAALLAILLGGLGIHHYYLGSIGAGVICLLLSCLCLGGILGIVEGIMLLTMSDEVFDAKYNGRTPESWEFVFTKT